MLQLLANSYHFQRPRSGFSERRGQPIYEANLLPETGLKADFPWFFYQNAGWSHFWGLPVSSYRRELHRPAVAGAKIGETLTASGYRAADFAIHCLGRCVPEGIKLEIRGRTTEMGSKGLDPFVHDPEHDLPGCLAICIIGGICDSPPFGLTDLIAADFAGASNRMVIIPGFQH